jgi:hypothetical protein
MNGVLDRLWEYIFSDPELRGYLGVWCLRTQK